jgi:putative ABC transport system permease protein
MLQNYFKIAVRNLLRNKTFSFINVFGLAIGMVACLFIVLFIKDELKFDQHNINKDSIYRVEGFYERGGKTFEQNASTSFALAPLLKTAFPEIKSFVRLNIESTVVKYKNKIYLEDRVCYADSNFFELFTCDFLKGNSANALYEPNTAVIDERFASKYFGNSNAIGEIIELGGIAVKITGVIKEMPKSAHFHPNMIVSVKTVLANYPTWVNDIHSGGTSHFTYLLLEKNYDSKKLELQFPAFIKKYISEDALKYERFYLRNLSDIHLHSQTNYEMEENGDIKYIYLLGVIAFIILLIACINYINLTTARAIDRAKEIGLRKVAGANKAQLIYQFLGESIFISFLAMIAAYCIACIFISKFNSISNKELSLLGANSYLILLCFIAFGFVIGLLSGIYPSFFITSIKLTQVLKGNLTKKNSSSLFLRKSLVIVQFSISIVLIISILLIYSQLQFIKNKKLGIKTEQLLTINLTDKINDHYQTFKTELFKNSNVIGISSANNNLTTGETNWRQYSCNNGEVKDLSIATMDVDEDFFVTLEATFVAGRGFSNNHPEDSTESYIINETAAKILNMNSPINEPLIGSLFNGKDWSYKKGKIIGVVKDFHFAALKQEIKPVVFNLQSFKTDKPSYLFVRINEKEVPSTIAFLENTWKKTEPEFPITHTFLNEQLKTLYKAEEKILQLFTVFCLLAIFISCLGIYGLSLYTAIQRKKEIAIRKVLGASVQRIVFLLSIDFIKLFLIAIIIACPIGWYLMNNWLADFAYRISISYWIFIIASVAAIFVAIVTISIQAIKVATTNPTKSLKTE